MDTLNNEKIREDTLVFFLTDNGGHNFHNPDGWNMEGFPDAIQGGKFSTSDLGTNVPLIMSWIGNVPVDSVNDDLVHVSDIFPTIMEATNTSYTRDSDATSFLQKVTENASSTREYIYEFYRPNSGDTVHRWVRDKTFKTYKYDDNEYKTFKVKSDVFEENDISDDSSVSSTIDYHKEIFDAYSSLEQAAIQRTLQ